MQFISNLLPSVSSFVDLSSNKEAWLVQAAMAVAYALFYTAYDKSTKSLSMPLLLDFLLIRPGPAKNRGLTWALNEWNKLISLVAITSLGLALAPTSFFRRISAPLAATSLVLILIHSTYSGLRYYGVADKLPALTDMIKPSPKMDKNKRLVVQLRAIAWAAGASSLLTLPFSFLTSSILSIALLLSLAHFWFMEIDYKLHLQIRPFAYIAFVVGAVALLSAVLQ
jgi:hypothetical protein